MARESPRIEDLLDELARGARMLRVFSHLHSQESPVSNAADHVLKLVLRQQPIHAAAVAGQIGIGPGAMSRHVAELEEAGLLRRVTCQADTRRHLLSVTEAGETRVRERDRERGARLARLLPDWNGSRLDQAIEMLGELNDAMGRGIGETKNATEQRKQGTRHE